MNSDQRKQIKKYFAPFPRWTIIVILAGVALTPFLWFIGLPAIVLGAVAIRQWKKRASDKEFDKLLNESIMDLRTRAMDKLRLEEGDLVREHEIIMSPTYWDLPKVIVGFKRGKDDIVRYTPIRVAMLFFVQHKLCIYQCTYDLTTGNPLNVSTKKYFYDDIVSSETQSTTLTIDEGYIKKETFKRLPDLKNHIENGRLQINQSEQFVLVTKGGNSVKIQLPDMTLLSYGLKGKLAVSRADQAIASVEAMLDDRKSVGHHRT